MEFRCEGRVDAPLQVVYETVRDRLPLLVPHMDNVSAIHELERKPGATGQWQVLNRWRADPGQVPSAVRSFLKPEMLEWLDRATWHDAQTAVDWTIEPNAFKGLYHCHGRNQFVADGAGTRLVITGSLSLDPSKVPGLPTILAKRLVPTIEDYLVERIKPNLASLATGVGRFLKAQA